MAPTREISRYITGWTALNVPRENADVADWHTEGVIRSGKLIIAGDNHTVAPGLEPGDLFDASAFIDQRGLDWPTRYCATPERAVLDMVYHSVFVRDGYPATIVLDDLLVEIDPAALKRRMTPWLAQATSRQRQALHQWMHDNGIPCNEGRVSHGRQAQVHNVPDDVRRAHDAWSKLIQESGKAAMLMHVLMSQLDRSTNAVVASHRTLARLMGVSARSIKTWLKTLEEGRWIQIVSLGPGTSNAYVVNRAVDWIQALDMPRHAAFNAKVLTLEEDQTAESLSVAALQQLPALFPSDEELLERLHDEEPFDMEHSSAEHLRQDRDDT